jgi:alkylation response protein AidB-like acyl-CoA dehydrogenase
LLSQLTELQTRQQALQAEPGDSAMAYRLRVRRWLDLNFPESWRPDRVTYATPEPDRQIAWERQLYEAGFAGYTWPAAYGGQGLTLSEQLIANEELGQVGIPDSLNAIGKDLIGPIILAVGSEEQKTRLLPRILSMDDIWCQAFSEPEAGSDLASVRTRAVQTEQGWLITGNKIWTSFAQHANWCVVLARTGDAALKHGSLSLFVVPMRSPGLRVRPISQIDGRANFSEIFFDNVEVDDNAVLGGINKGWIAAGRVLEMERAINRMYRAALFENELRHLVSACLHDRALSALLEMGVYRDRIGALYADIEVLRRLVRRTVLSLVQGGALNGAGSLIKLHWSETHQRLTALGREMLAHAARPLSPVTARAVARFNELYLRSRAETIQAGASAVQLGIIAQRILGLPRS